MSEPKFPAGWDAARVKRLIDYSQGLSEDEQVAEAEAAATDHLRTVGCHGPGRPAPRDPAAPGQLQVGLIIPYYGNEDIPAGFVDQVTT